MQLCKSNDHDWWTGAVAGFTMWIGTAHAAALQAPFRTSASDVGTMRGKTHLVELHFPLCQQSGFHEQFAPLHICSFQPIRKLETDRQTGACSLLPRQERQPCASRSYSERPHLRTP
jgi:hypothetical protein